MSEHSIAVAFEMLDFLDENHNNPGDSELLDLSDYESYSQPIMERYQLPSYENKNYSVLASFTGDDTVQETDLPEIAVAQMYAAEKILGFKISSSDVGFSKDITNYAEDWHILPPSIWSTFDGVNFYHKGEGIPMVLDPVKVRDLSPVRKQSNMETDLKTKFESVAVKANWTAKEWISYDFHQLAMILSCAIFDFESEVRFPFLHKAEGGCGGAPPWNNLQTAESAIHYFNRGRSSIGIYGIMNESYKIQSGLMEPNESIFCRYSHLAASGDLVWKNQLEHLKQGRNLGYSDREIMDMITEEDTELNPYKYEISMNRFLVPTLNLLRREGYIESELDVKLRKLSRDRLEVLKSDLPFHDYLVMEAEKKKFLKQRSLKLLCNLFEKDRIELELEAPNFKIGILRNYFKVRSENIAYPAMFGYSGTFRLFISEEIKHLFDNSNKKTLFEKITGLRYSRKAVEYKWLQPLISGMTTEIPILANDDARILNQIDSIGIPGTVVVLISNDKKLCELAKGKAQMRGLKFSQWKVDDFINFCVRDPGEKGFQIVSLNYFNVIQKAWRNSSDAYARVFLEKHVGWRKEQFSLSILYDLPNIEKRLASFKYNRGYLAKKHHKFLRKTAVSEEYDLHMWELELPYVFANLID